MRLHILDEILHHGRLASVSLDARVDGFDALGRMKAIREPTIRPAPSPLLLARAHRFKPRRLALNLISPSCRVVADEGGEFCPLDVERALRARVAVFAQAPPKLRCFAPELIPTCPDEQWLDVPVKVLSKMINAQQMYDVLPRVVHRERHRRIAVREQHGGARAKH